MGRTRVLISISSPTRRVRVMTKKLLLAALAFTALTGAVSAAPLEPFLFFSDYGGTYQGSGWVKSKFLVGCHEVDSMGSTLHAARNARPSVFAVCYSAKEGWSYRADICHFSTSTLWRTG